MFIGQSIYRTVFLIALSCGPLLSQQHSPEAPLRDSRSLEILARVVQAAGGIQVLGIVGSLSESGEITFYWGENVKGPVTIRTLGGNHFRMEADLPKGKSIWIVKDGVGSKKEEGHVLPISRENAINLCNLTYPVGYVASALTDLNSDVSFVGVEKWAGRSVYRLKMKGQLGLVSKASLGGPVVKEVLIDALTFDIVSVEDRPLPHRAYATHHTPSRVIEYGDFRVVKGVRIPFLIDTKLAGQKTLTISLSEITLNGNLDDEDFGN
jgi:hypothetical protein